MKPAGRVWGLSAVAISCDKRDFVYSSDGSLVNLGIIPLLSSTIDLGILSYARDTFFLITSYTILLFLSAVCPAYHLTMGDHILFCYGIYPDSQC
jgi:hypothetical protein